MLASSVAQPAKPVSPPGQPGPAPPKSSLVEAVDLPFVFLEDEMSFNLCRWTCPESRNQFRRGGEIRVSVPWARPGGRISWLGLGWWLAIPSSSWGTAFAILRDGKGDCLLHTHTAPFLGIKSQLLTAAECDLSLPSLHRPPSCSHDSPGTVLPEGLRTCCSLSQEYYSPSVGCPKGSFSSSESYPKDHFLSAAFPDPFGQSILPSDP